MSTQRNRLLEKTNMSQVGRMQKILAVLVTISIVVSGISLAYVIRHEEMIRDLAEPVEYLKIGVLAPLSGPWGEFGAYLRDNCILAAEEINARGGVLGKQIQLFFGDSEGKPEMGVSAVELLIDLDGIDFLVGGWASSVTIAVMEVVADREIIFVNGNSLSEQITEKIVDNPDRYWMVFKLLPGTELYSVCAVEFMDYLEQEELFVPTTRVSALIVEDTDWGRSAVVHAQTLLEQYEWEIGALEYVTAGETDFYPILTKVKEQETELVLALVGTVPACVALNKQFRELEIPAIFMPYVAATDAKYRQFAGEAADGVTWISFPSYLPDVHPPATVLENKFMARFGTINTGGNADAYCSMMVLIDAIEKAGSLDNQKIAEEILKIHWNGPMGINAFDPETQTGLAGENYMFPTMNQIWADYGLDSIYPKGYPVWPETIAFREFRLPQWIP